MILAFASYETLGCSADWGLSSAQLGSAQLGSARLPSVVGANLSPRVDII